MSDSSAEEYHHVTRGPPLCLHVERLPVGKRHKIDLELWNLLRERKVLPWRRRLAVTILDKPKILDGFAGSSGQPEAILTSLFQPFSTDLFHSEPLISRSCAELLFQSNR